MIKKRATSVVLAILLMFSLSSTITLPVFAVSATSNDAVIWANSQIGKGLDYDGIYGTQCVDLIKYYYAYLGVSPVQGNGCDYATNALPSGWSRIKYYSGFVPQPGDIAVWTYSTTANGHVAIVTSADSSKMNVVEQNSHKTVRAWQYPYSYGTFYGVIRPNFSDMSTDPPEAPKNIRTSNGKKVFSDKEYITFFWDASVSATDYWVYMWKDGQQIYVTDMGNATSFTSAPTSKGRYTLIVRAGNSFGYSNGPASIDFVVYDDIPDSPQNLKTINNRTEFSTSESISFTWDSVSTATNYIVSLWRNGVMLYETDMNETTGFTSAPIMPGKYTFTVKAKNNYGASNSVTFDFTVGLYTITYSSNGGTGGPGKQTKIYGKPLILSTIEPTKGGYNFCGWATEPNGLVKYKPGSIYTEERDITLYAVWEKATKFGDVNGDGTVDAVDARWVLQAAAGMRTLANTAAADVNGDNQIDAVDARWILQAAAGMRAL